MNIGIRKWRLSDAKDLAETLSNRNVVNNLRDVKSSSSISSLTFT